MPHHYAEGVNGLGTNDKRQIKKTGDKRQKTNKKGELFLYSPRPSSIYWPKSSLIKIDRPVGPYGRWGGGEGRSHRAVANGRVIGVFPLVGDGLGTTGPRDRRGASHKSSLLEKGGLGFKEPALLTYATLPAYLLGRGCRDLCKSRRWDQRPPNTNKETGQFPSGRAFVVIQRAPLRGRSQSWNHICSRGHGAKERWARRVGARRDTLIKPSTTSGGGRHLLEVARRDDLSGLLVAVLDRSFSPSRKS